MSNKNRILALGALVAAGAGAVVVHGAGASGVPASPPGLSSLSAGSESVDTGTAGKLSAAFSDAKGTDNPIADADFSRAHPFAIQNSAATGFLVPTPTSVCVVIPDPVDGYGAGCNTTSNVLNGEATTVLKSVADGAAPATVVSVVRDGGQAPQVSRADGTSAALTVKGNVAAAQLASSDTVTAGKTVTKLSQLR